MNFPGGINCPPYETADGYLTTTEGCSHNTCLFCTYFKDQKYRKCSIEEIESDIKEIPRHFGAPKRIFLLQYVSGNPVSDAAADRSGRVSAGSEAHYGKYCSSIQRVYLHRADIAALLALFFHALDGLIGGEQRGRPDP